MVCEHCGQENLPSAAACAGCGQPLPRRPLSIAAAISPVLGVLGLAGGITAVPGLVLAVVALTRIEKSRGQLRGVRLAIAGAVLSGLTLIIGPALVFPAMLRATEQSKATVCHQHLQQLARAFQAYAREHDGRLPAARSWSKDLSPYVRSPQVLQCPAVRARCAYALNQEVAGRKLADLPSKTVLAFECDLGWNGAGDPARVITRARHLDNQNYLVTVAGKVENRSGPTSFG